MERWIVLLTLGVLFVFTEFGGVYAQNAQEKKKEEVSSEADKESHEPGEAKKVEERLEKEFSVSDARIDSLRKQNLGYGEIRRVLSMAKQMPGGINDENINKIMELRQGDGKHKEGWGNVARDLGLKKNEGKKEHRESSQDDRGEKIGGKDKHRGDHQEWRGNSMSSPGSSNSHGGGRHRS